MDDPPQAPLTFYCVHLMSYRNLDVTRTRTVTFTFLVSLHLSKISIVANMSMISCRRRPGFGARRTAKLQQSGDMAKFLAEKFFGEFPVGGGLPVISELRVQNYCLSANWPNFLGTFFEKNLRDLEGS